MNIKSSNSLDLFRFHGGSIFGPFCILNSILTGLWVGSCLHNYVQLNGDEARRLYLEEIEHAKRPEVAPTHSVRESRRRKRKIAAKQITDKDLFLSVQNNDIDTLRQALDSSPDTINVLDDYGWSLLMIACQANAVEATSELLKRGVDTSIRDKAGNSAQNIVIKNRNLALANLLVTHRSSKTNLPKVENKIKKVKLKEYECKICNRTFPDKQEHLSSTIHNINASKGRKLPTNYVIPESNKGYQIMLRVGWDKESGLGPDGSGNKYPIKTVKKEDRKGLGHEKKKEAKTEEKTSKILQSDYEHSKRIEINFRREFY